MLDVVHLSPRGDEHAHLAELRLGLSRLDGERLDRLAEAVSRPELRKAAQRPHALAGDLVVAISAADIEPLLATLDDSYLQSGAGSAGGHRPRRPGVARGAPSLRSLDRMLGPPWAGTIAGARRNGSE